MAVESHTYIRRDVNHTNKSPTKENKTDNTNTKYRNINVIYTPAHQYIAKCL